ncbi:hypothetical protein ACFY41_02995 [Streptomyces syringium]|uniref:hypothetical protein n=1 Tax=Streptomyces syringium TaxID=76729 RepID=UPI00369A32DB
MGPHRRTYPDQDDPAGHPRKWVDPDLVTAAECESDPILDREKVVSVLIAEHQRFIEAGARRRMR